MFAVVAAVLAASSARSHVIPWDCDKGRAVPWHGHASLSVKEAISLATVAARQSGFALGDPIMQGVCFSSKGEPRWTIIFDSKLPGPGSMFLVWIRDDNKVVTVMPGQ